MSQPPSYTPVTDFSQDEVDSVGGRSTIRTAALDGELTAIEETLDATLTNLALIQRDDGKIRDETVELHTLSAQVKALLTAGNVTASNLRGDWLTATAYVKLDVVVQSANTYICAVAHTSGTFATDLAADKWILLTLGAATAASSIPFTPTATIAASNVQAAIEESDTECRALSAAALAAASAAVPTATLADATQGDALVATQSSLASSVADTQHGVNERRVSIFDFFTAGQRSNVLNRVQSGDVRDAVQTAITVLSAAGGGTLDCPRGIYNCTSGEILMAPNVILDGAGQRATIFFFRGAGNGFCVFNTVNGSTNARVGFRNLGIVTDNLSCLGAGIVDIGSHFCDLFNLHIYGFLHEVILDQTEVSTVDRCYLENGIATEIWGLNGPDYTPALTFTGALSLAATSGTLTSNWTGTTGLYHAAFVQTVGSAQEHRTVNLTNGSASVTWTGGLSAACNATTTGASAGYTNRITISRTAFNSPATTICVALDGGIVYDASNNNFNGGLQHMRLAGLSVVNIGVNEYEQAAGPCITLQATRLNGSATSQCSAVKIETGAFIPTVGQNAIQVIAAASLTLLNNSFSNALSAAASVAITSLSHLISIGNRDLNPYSGAASFSFIKDAFSSSDTIISAGVRFGNAGGTGTGVSTSKVVNDYDRGNFTPVLTATGATFAYAANGQLGRYERRGKNYRVKIYIQLAAAGNTLSANALSITGLPFTSVNATNALSFGSVVWSNITATLVNAACQVSSNSTTVGLFKLTAAATGFTQMIANDLHATNGSVLQLDFEIEGA